MKCMAMGKKGDAQDDLFVSYKEMRSAGHPFYRALDSILRDGGFDGYTEKVCAKFYAAVLGRPGLAPGNYFRGLFIGYFEGIETTCDPTTPHRTMMRANVVCPAIADIVSEDVSRSERVGRVFYGVYAAVYGIEGLLPSMSLGYHYCLQPCCSHWPAS